MVNNVLNCMMGYIKLTDILQKIVEVCSYQVVLVSLCLRLNYSCIFLSLKINISCTSAIFLYGLVVAKFVSIEKTNKKHNRNDGSSALLLSVPCIGPRL